MPDLEVFKVPTGHEQVDEPSAEINEVGHGAHSLAIEAEYVLAEQLRQCMFPTPEE